MNKWSAVFLVFCHFTSFLGHSCVSPGSGGITASELRGMFSLKMPSRRIIFSQNSQGKQSKEQLLFNSCQSHFSVVMKGHCNQSVTAIVARFWLVYFGPPSMSPLSWWSQTWNSDQMLKSHLDYCVCVFCLSYSTTLHTADLKLCKMWPKYKKNNVWSTLKSVHLSHTQWPLTIQTALLS